MAIQSQLKILGYHQNWLDFGILTPEILTLQIANFHNGDDKNTEHFRYGCFMDFIRRNEQFSDVQIEHFITLAQQDDDNLMAGSALKMLFESQKLTPTQFDKVKEVLPNFGDWAVKLIEKNRLMITLSEQPFTDESLKECLEFSKTYQSNVLLQIIVEQTEDKAILERFTTDKFGKKIRNLAKQKLKRLQK